MRTELQTKEERKALFGLIDVIKENTQTLADMSRPMFNGVRYKLIPSLPRDSALRSVRLPIIVQKVISDFIQSAEKYYMPRMKLKTL